MKQTNINFIIKEKSLDLTGKLFFKGIAGSNRKDSDAETLFITPNALKNAWVEFEKAGAPMLVEHGLDEVFESRVVGRVLTMVHDNPDIDLDTPNWPNTKILVTGVITDPDVIKEILSGERNDLSLSWSIMDFLVNPKDPGQQLHTAIVLRELSVCKVGANFDARLEMVTESELRQGAQIEMFGQRATILSFDNEKMELDFGFAKMKSVSVKYKKAEKKTRRQTRSFIVNKKTTYGKNTRRQLRKLRK